jgi:hypothetical protein
MVNGDQLQSPPKSADQQYGSLSTRGVKVGLIVDTERAAREERLRELVAEYARTNPGYRLAAWLLENGQFFTPAPLPPGMERGGLGLCDINTMFEVLLRPKLYRFTEGFGLAEDKAVKHTWAITADGAVVDTTWDMPESRAYFGFPLDYDTLIATGERNKVFSPLEWYVMKLAG